MRAIFWRGRLRRARGTLRDLLFGRLFAKAPCTVYGCAPSCACFRAEPVVFAFAFGRAAISCFLLFTCFSGRREGLLRGRFCSSSAITCGFTKS